jgi:hypothetical protein
VAPLENKGEANMNLRQVLLVAVAFIGAVSSGDAGNAQHNGDWWREQTQSAKYHYAAELFDGMTVGLNFLEFGMSTDILIKTGAPNADEAASQKCVHVSGRQLVSGLDELYFDSQNRNITVANASMVVVHSVSGMPQGALLKMIEQFRKPGC